ncbi:IMP dehydrogenase [Acanthopleuribacter pedis]|uniref:Inosine-5'-monophosphate dehydrogenase n=1 Tax=Acanthopleuribacter pedis TaxID=442870 RepID=A0A8J7U2J2_9BACT|nr:IMP dehydrogenase [Acanthopleuribacter pedis]MBO1317774.1 IMP dehydrogenase [Acanthopleuribacter pedis]
MLEFPILEALTFDDVILIPSLAQFHPNDADTRTRLVGDIELNIPFLSAAMDTVTEHRLAIAMAQQGGIGVVHKNLSIEEQAENIDRVKRSESGMITDPITIGPDEAIQRAEDMMSHFRISGIPVVEKDGTLLGIITNRDLRFETNYAQPVSNVMTSGRDKLITVPVGTTLEEAKYYLHKHRIEKVLVVDDKYALRGLITVKDIQKKIEYPRACKDGQGRLRVAAALGIGAGMMERAQALVNAKADLMVLDSSHGHSTGVIKATREFKQAFPDVPLLVGNVATGEGTKALIDAGADAVKVGIGPGSICTTRVVTGAGMPQITAISEAVKAAKHTDTTIIADGGIKFSGDITKALAAGAHAVMIGSLFAGTDESPGETVLYQGRTYKTYRGMGSIGAMKDGSADRYFQEDASQTKMVPEGIEGQVPYKGSLSAVVTQLLGGLRAGMGLTGCQTLAQLRENARFAKVSQAGLRENHAHDVIITKEAPNYRL